MTFTQIKHFIAVVENMSFSKAAEAVFITQSAISRQILSLENELGLHLFNRGFRSISLTSAGKVMYDAFTKINNDLEKSVQEALNRRGRLSGKLAVGLFNEANLYNLYAGRMEQFCSDQPDVSLIWKVYHLNEMYGALSTSEVDVLITVKESLLGKKASRRTIYASKENISLFRPSIPWQPKRIFAFPT